MFIKEYRIALPMSVDEYRIAQLYMIQRKSREESHGTGSGVEIIENEPYTNGPGGNGQYTYKIYHIGSHLPGWFRAILPKSALRVEEEAWNAYPYTKTKYTCPFVEKFSLEIETIYLNDGGEQENVFNMSEIEKKQRVIDFIDIVRDPISSGDYRKEEDPKIYRSSKTGRGPLDENWRRDYSAAVKEPYNKSKKIMTAYKLCKVEFKYWGMQNKIEKFIHDIGLRKTMLRAHRQAWAWQDEWYGLKLSDIRKLERETQMALKEKMAVSSGEEEDEEVGTAKSNKPLSSGHEILNDYDATLPGSKSHDSLKSGGNASTANNTRSASHSGSKIQRRVSFDSPRSLPKFVKDTPRDLASWRLESLEKLQESSDSEDDEFFDATVGSKAPDSKQHKTLCLDAQISTVQEEVLQSSDTAFYRSNSNEYISQTDDFFNSDDLTFDKRVEQYRQMYSIDSSHLSSMQASSVPSSNVTGLQYLILVLHGGGVLDSGSELGTKRSDFATLKSTFESVILSNYKAAAGQLAFRLVPCPNTCTETLNILSSLSPYNYESPTIIGNEKNLEWTQEFVPLGAIALFASSSAEYQDQVNAVIAKANLVYDEFLQSDEGRGFCGQVCFIADSMGALLAYDALCRANPLFFKTLEGSQDSLAEDIRLQASPRSEDSSAFVQKTRKAFAETRQLSQSDSDLVKESATKDREEKKFSKSDVVPSDYELQHHGSVRQNSIRLKFKPRSHETSRRTSSASRYDSSYLRLDFEVTDFFMFGSPLGLVLAYRRLFTGEDKSYPPLRPACHQVYNLFHSSDPTAIRMEPLIHDCFKHIQPAKVPRFNRFPHGDCESIHVVEAIQSHGYLFGEQHRRSISPGHQLLQRQPSIGSITSDTSGLGELPGSSISNVTTRWWGNKRIDFILYCPDVLHSFPTNALPHLFHASFWESSDVVAFMLRQLLRREMYENDQTAELRISSQDTSVHRKEKWLKRRTTIKVRNLQPNHRANDVIVLEDKEHILTAKFMYGPLDMTSLSGEKVDIHVMMQPTSGEWSFMGTEVTDRHGKLVYKIPQAKKLSQGMYPVKVVVRGDHTFVDFFLAVLPPKTETVIFSIDGSFTASVSIMGKDPKVRAGAVDVVRHWQELGNLILYVTARPDMQHKKVVSWLAQHNFPHGMVAFMDGLSKDPLKQKLHYLKNLQLEAQLLYKAGYGSSKDINVYKELGVQPRQIFIVGKASKKQHLSAQILTDGYAAHLDDLMAPGGSRPASGNARIFLQRGCFSLPVASEGKKPAKRTSSYPPFSKQPEQNKGDSTPTQQPNIVVTEHGNTLLQPSRADSFKKSRVRGTSPRPKLPSYHDTTV